MNPLNPQYVINLFLQRGIDGYFLNGHKELVEWLDSNPDKQYYIQLLPDELGVISYNNVRLWSSEQSMILAEERKKSVVVDVESRDSSNSKILDPLVEQLYEACDKKDFQLVLELKKKLRGLGIRYDKQRTSIRELI